MKFIIYQLLVIVVFAHTAVATVIFQFNGESGYQYMGSANAHPGGGYFSHMGGSVSKPEGVYDASCISDTSNYHFTVLSNSVAAQGASAGSAYSIKTPYLGVCPNQAFLRDTTVVTTPLLSEYWVQWKQKWTGNFQGTTQQKFVKFYNSEDTLERTMTAYFPMEPQPAASTTSGRFVAYFNNIEGAFNRECPTLSAAQTKIASVGPCSTPNHSYDNSSATTSDIYFETDRWYTITMHSKLNSSNEVADAVYEVWIDGVLRLSLTDFKMKDGVTYNTPGTNQFEFQHIYYTRSSVDQTTYMDDLIISTSPIQIDTYTPTTTVSPAAGRYAAKQQVTLTPSETATTYYCIDTANSCTPIIEGTTATVYPGSYLRYYSVDGANNAEAVKSAHYGWPTTCK